MYGSCGGAIGGKLLARQSAEGDFRGSFRHGRSVGIVVVCATPLDTDPARYFVLGCGISGGKRSAMLLRALSVHNMYQLGYVVHGL